VFDSDGLIAQDFIYVDDVVDAIIWSATTEEAYGQTFNVGNVSVSNFRELAETIVREARSGRWEYSDYSAERAILEPGDQSADIRKIGRIVGWKPSTSLEEGIRKTLEYYRRNKAHYWS